jgi:hypothetical protein
MALCKSCTVFSEIMGGSEKSLLFFSPGI